MKSKTKTKKAAGKINKSAVIVAVTALLAASGLTGYKLVKEGNYGGIEENLHEVAQVVDGDTFEIADKNNGVITVRILNIDAPDRGECYYSESKKALTKLLEDKKVRLEKDVSGVDSYGRLLRHVYISSETEEEDNIIVAKYMIENGWAQALPVLPDVRYKTYLARFSTEAEEEQLGVWRECQGNLPKSFTETTDASPTDKNCLIKGNVSQNNGEKIYFLLECPSYSQTKIDPSKGERYFCTEQEAQSVGFHISGGCTTVFKKN